MELREEIIGETGIRSGFWRDVYVQIRRGSQYDEIILAAVQDLCWSSDKGTSYANRDEFGNITGFHRDDYTGEPV